ncbi:copper amine oxidase [Thalassobacillus sp. CUG 92003]|uniref:copper amine oxidase n=1 Tax=Thalassobacillus sp. CUG 92003 TaxID=2736641 RepID=UPI0021085EA2|nr:copper amine oxidase [Thalassobacillus sp. CUG 92003]
MTIKRILVMMMAAMLLVPSLTSAHNGESHAASKTPASDLRADLDQLLSEHFTLAVMTMMKQYDEVEDAEASRAALDQNAADMTPAIASVYGEEAAKQFEDIFREHNDYTDKLVTAAKEGDEAARTEAEQEMEAFVTEFSSFLDQATEGNLPAEDAEELVRAHEMDVINTFDHYVNGEYQKAYQTFREGFKRMYDVSKGLFGAIVTQMPDEFNNTKADTASADLRSTLNRFASEHFALAVQKGFNNAEDFDFTTWAEGQHTEDFTAAIQSVYGKDSASQFEKVWQQDHLDAQGDVVSAALEEDEEARMKAEERLHMFADEFGNFLGKATEGNLPADAATDAVWKQEESVLKTFDQYVAGDYEASYESFRGGFGYMFGVGETLSEAIVKQMPDTYGQDDMPEAMPDTGMGRHQSGG